MPIIALITTLLFCAFFIVFILHWINHKSIRDFQEISTEIGLNFALPQRADFLEIPEPALVGYYNQRYVQVNVDGKDENGNTMTTFLVSCENDNLKFTIRKRAWVERNFSSSKYKDFQNTTNLFTGDRVFDKYFAIYTSQTMARRLFTGRVREYLLNNYDLISNHIEVNNFEMVIRDNKLLSFGQALQKQTITNQLDLLNGLADLLEAKIALLNQRPEVKRAKLEEKLNFKWR
jgi:hypothetical protein